MIFWTMSKQIHRKKWRIYHNFGLYVCFLDPGLIQLPNFHSTVHWNVLRETFYLHLHMQGNRILERQSFFSSFVIFWLSARPDICRILLHPYIPQFSPGHFTLQCWRCQFSMEMLNINFTNFFYWIFYLKITRRPQSKPLIWSKSMVFLMVKQ